MIRYDDSKLQEAYERGRADERKEIRRELIDSDLLTFSDVVDYLNEDSFLMKRFLEVK